MSDDEINAPLLQRNAEDRDAEEQLAADRLAAAQAASPSQAWQQSLAAARDGDPAAARRWLERAFRLAPNDPRIAFDLANLYVAQSRLADDLSFAETQFERLATRYELAPAWLGLMAARRLAGDHQGAAQALAAMLARHCVPEQAQFGDVATLVAAAAGAAGWCGVSAAGLVVVTTAEKSRVSLVLDGKPQRPPKGDGGFALPAGSALAVSAGGRSLLGSPLDLAALRRLEGVVENGPEGLIGWASRPAAPAYPPLLTLFDAKGGSLPVRCDGVLEPELDAPFLQRHKFLIPASQLRGLQAPLRLCTPNGDDLFGSPLDLAALPMAPAGPARRGCLVQLKPPRRRLTVVVPVYRGLAVTETCLNALLAALPRGAKIIVVDDATPEPALAAWLDEAAAAGRFMLLRHSRNLGFPAAANAGMRAAGRSDILLLNSDTLLPPGAIETMTEVAYSRPDIGSVTPFSNAATILNYPDPHADNPAPDLAETSRLNAMAKQANGSNAVEIPTGVGFCMLLRHDCIAATGMFRGEIFAQGYGEENDWCLRARTVGYTHAAATGAYVAHLGGVSFRSAGRALNQRNAARLNRLYPDYHAMIMAAIDADALAPARRKLDALRFAAARNEAGAVLLISHNHGGGVARQVAVAMQAIRAAGRRPLLLFPATPPDPRDTPFPWQTQLTDDQPNGYPNLRFTLPAEMPALVRLLRAEGVSLVELHHALGHHPAVRGLAGLLGVPQDIMIHDYASFCLRVNLLTRPQPEARLRYCGEPNVAGCIACIAANGDETFEGLGVERNLARSTLEFAAARRVTAPSADAAARINRHFPGVKPLVTPWEDDAPAIRLQPPGTGPRRKIVIIGGIGPAKGYDLLIDCANDAVQRDLPLDFVVAGASAEDGRLLQTGRIFVTGEYQEAEATRLIASVQADLAFLPSIWPETWCFTLSEAWRAGLYAIAFDLGAQAARIRATGRGALLPLGLPISRINDALLAWQPNSRNSQAANKTVF